MKKFVSVFVLLVTMVFTCVSVGGNGKSVESISEKDFEKSTYEITDLRKVSEEVIFRLDREGGFRHGVIYKVGDFKVIYVKTPEDRERLWEILEDRKYGERIIEVSRGRVVNKKGDGECEDGTYVGYRVDGVPHPEYYITGKKVNSVFLCTVT